MGKFVSQMSLITRSLSETICDRRGTWNGHWSLAISRCQREGRQFEPGFPLHFAPNGPIGPREDRGLSFLGRLGTALVPWSTGARDVSARLRSCRVGSATVDRVRRQRRVLCGTSDLCVPNSATRTANPVPKTANPSPFTRRRRHLRSGRAPRRPEAVWQGAPGTRSIYGAGPWRVPLGCRSPRTNGALRCATPGKIVGKFLGRYPSDPVSRVTDLPPVLGHYEPVREVDGPVAG